MSAETRGPLRPGVRDAVRNTNERRQGRPGERGILERENGDETRPVFLQRYAAERLISSSPEVEVHLARDLLSGGARVVVKSTPGRIGSSGRANRLAEEYAHLSALRHPGLPEALDFGEDLALRRTILITRRAPGRPLDRCAPLAPDEAREILIQLARVLAAVHARGLLHLDVKPRNVIYHRRRGLATLLDLDLAAPPSRARSRGTLPYAAPEVLGPGPEPRPSADLYSLGVTILEILAGGSLRPEFQPGDMSAALPDGDLMGIVHRLCAKDPEARFQDARSVLRALRTAGPVPLETRESRRLALSFPPAVPMGAVQDAIRRAVDGAEGQRAALLVVDGAAGLGKSRHLQEAAVAWRQAGYQIISAPSSPGRARTLAPIRELLTMLARLRRRGGETLSALFESPAAMRSGLLERMVAATLDLAARGRTVLLLDDVHRYDRSSRDFLLHLLRRILHETGEREGRPPLQVAIGADLMSLRDDPFRAWIQGELESEFVSLAALKPFSPSQSIKFVRSMVAPENPGEDLCRALHERCGGNPALIRDAILFHPSRKSGGGTRLGALARMAPADISLPPSAEAMIHAQLRLVDRKDRLLLARVALFPEGLSEAHLGRLAKGKRVRESIRNLLESKLLVASGDRLYTTDRLRSRTLASLLSSGDRRRIHDRTVALMKKEGAPLDEQAPHLLQGSDVHAGLDAAFAVIPQLISSHREAEVSRLLRLLGDAGDASPFAYRVGLLHVFDMAIARGQLETARRAISRLEEAPSAFPYDLQICRRLARLRMREGHSDAARRVLEGLLEPTIETSRDDRADLEMDLVELLLSGGHMIEARSRLNRIAQSLDLDGLVAALGAAGDDVAEDDDVLFAYLSGRIDDPDSLARISRFLTLDADLARADGRHGTCLAAWMLVMRLKSRAGDLPGLARALHGVGTVYMKLGNSHLAERYYRRALRLRGEVGDIAGLGDTANNLGVLLRKVGRTAEALDQFRSSLRHRRQIGHIAGEGYSYINIANVHYERRELDAALRYYERALLVARRLNDSRSEAQVINNLGAVASLRGLYEEAILHFEEAERLDRLAGNILAAVGRRINRAESHLSLGNGREAEFLLASARRLLERRGESSFDQILLLGEARLVRLRGGAVAAERALLMRAASCCTESALPDVQLELAGASLREGRPEQAIEELDKAGDASSPELLARGEAIRAEALIALKERNLHEVLMGIGEGERIARRAQMTMLEFRCARARGQIKTYQGDLHLAARAYAGALDALERLIHSIKREDLRSCFVASPDVAGFREEAVGLAQSVKSEGEPPPGSAASDFLKTVRESLYSVEQKMGGPERFPRRDDEALRRLLDLSRTLRTTAPLDELLTQIVDGVIEFSRAERAFLITVDDRGTMRIPVARTRDQESIAEPRLQVSNKILGDVLASGKSVCLTDAVESHYAHIDSVLNLELRSVVCTPMFRGGRVVGMLYVDNRSRAGQFTGRDQELLDIFAAQAAVTIENSRMAREHARDEKLRVLGRLAGDVAHDFNNLLTAILGRSELLAVRAIDEETRADLAVIRKAAMDGGEVVRHLQDLSRVHRGRGCQPVHLRSLVGDALEFVRPRIDGHRAGFGALIPVIDVPPDLIAEGTPSELREIFTNLMLNSIAAMPEGGVLSVGAAAMESGDRVQVVVSDTGVGMSEEVLESVFDPYFTTRGEGGSGLGMSIARNIVDRHGGAIRVESAPGEGTRVIFDLPVFRERGASANGGRGPSADGGGLRGRQILVVEDERSIRDVLASVLTGQGCLVETSGDGFEAIEAFERRGHDLVLTDLGMAPCNGWEVAARVKLINPRTPVLLLTGWGAEIEEAQARARGVDLILRKPFEVDALLQSVLSVLEGRDAYPQ